MLILGGFTVNLPPDPDSESKYFSSLPTNANTKSIVSLHPRRLPLLLLPRCCAKRPRLRRWPFYPSFNPHPLPCNPVLMADTVVPVTRSRNPITICLTGRNSTTRLEKSCGQEL